MDPSEAARLSDLERIFQLVVLGAAGVVLALDVALIATHVATLHGHVLLPPPMQRRAGWLLLGLTVGLLTFYAAAWSAGVWIFVVVVSGWLGWWGWRLGRLDDVGLALIGSAIPWTVAYAFFLLVAPADPTVHEIPDRRLFVLVAALVVATLGAALVLGPPAAGHRRSPVTPTERWVQLFAIIERAQALGPVSAPVTVGFLGGLAASTVVLVLLRESQPVIRSLLTSVAFVAVALALWHLTVPPRVAQAYGVLRWVARSERRLWQARLGRPLPRTPNGIRQFLSRLPDVPLVQPLRIEVLATLGETAEARRELQRLDLEGPVAEAEAAELAAYVSWCEGGADPSALARLERSIEAIDEPEVRLRFLAALASARARQEALTGSEGAVDHLVGVHRRLGVRATAFALPYAWAIVIVFVLAGLMSGVLGTLTRS